MRFRRSVRFALLGVVSQHPGGLHGYALKRQCERMLGSFWQLNFGEVYRVLDRLAQEELVEQVLGGGPAHRKVFRITQKGRRSLDNFILAPPTDAPRPLRQELAVKLLFAAPERLAELIELVGHQRSAYLRELHRLKVQRGRIERAPVDGFVTKLLIDGAELSVRAELAWLDDVTQALQERFSASP